MRISKATVGNKTLNHPKYVTKPSFYFPRMINLQKNNTALAISGYSSYSIYDSDRFKGESTHFQLPAIFCNDSLFKFEYLYVLNDEKNLLFSSYMFCLFLVKNKQQTARLKLSTDTRT